MSDLPVPAVLAILLLVLLVLIVLIVLALRGRRDAPASNAVPTERADRTAVTSEDAGPEGSDAADTELPDGEPDDVGPTAPSPADDDPRPWRERHGRRASRPLLSELSAAERAAEPPAARGAVEAPGAGEAPTAGEAPAAGDAAEDGIEAESWEVSPEEPTGRSS